MVDYTFNDIVNQTVTFLPSADTIDFGSRSAASVIFATSGNLLTATSTTPTIGTVRFDSTAVATSTTLAGFTLANTHFIDGSVLAVGDLTSNVTIDGGADTLDFTTNSALTNALNKDNQVHGMGGADVINLTGGRGNNLLYGDAGGDSITFGDGNNTIYGGSGGADTTDGADTIVAGSGSNIIYGNGGADLVSFSAVTSSGHGLTFYGGVGADSISADNGGGSFFVNSGPDSDTITLTHMIGNVTVFGGSGGDKMDFTGSSSAMTVYGGTGLVDSSDGADSIISGNGTSVFYTNAGADKIVLNAAVSQTDTVYLGKGADSVVSGANAGDYLIFGGGDGDNINLGSHLGNATVYGGAGASDSTDAADTIVGSSSGNDVIFGNAGNDVITVTTDANHHATVYGGAGNDTISASPTSSGADITLFGNIGDDAFKLNFSGGHPTMHLADYGTGKDITNITLSGGDAAHLTVDHTTLRTIISNGSAEALVYDTYAGNFSKTSFVISGGSILETNFAGKAATLGGGAGNDQLIAGDLGDTLTAGAGIDVLMGGSGNDRFEFKTADLNQSDTISGGGGTDILGLGTSGTGIVDLDFAHVTQVETLVLESGDYSTTKGVTLGSFANAAGFNAVDASAASAANVTMQGLFRNASYIGATAADSVIGSNHDDTMNGRAGDDTIIGADGNDTITGGDGADVFGYRDGAQDGSDIITDAIFGVTGTVSGSTKLDKLQFASGAGAMNLGNNNTTVDGAILTSIVAAGAAGTEVIILRGIGIASSQIDNKLDIIDANVAVGGGSVSIFYDTTKGHAVMYYDFNGSTAGGHHLLADFTNMTALADMDKVDFTDILFV